VGSGLQSARFYTTVAKRNQIPPAQVPEVAFAGRSNAGKSSAINRICQRKRLAFASKTPGRTQALNYFAIGPENQPEQAFLVDTPGYGYASVPQEVKKDWQGLAGWYLNKRENLVGLVLMVDCRRLLTQLDADLLNWVPADVNRLILITKADKLKQQAQRKTLTEIQDQYFELQPDTAATFLLFSSTKGQGVEQARSVIEEWLVEAPPIEAKSPSEPARPPHDEPTQRRRAKKNPVDNAPGSKPVNRGARSGRRNGR